MAELVLSVNECKVQSRELKQKGGGEKRRTALQDERPFPSNIALAENLEAVLIFRSVWHLGSMRLLPSCLLLPMGF